MCYRGGGIGHVETSTDLMHDDDGWMDVYEPSDINLPLNPGDDDDDGGDGESQEGGSEIDGEEEEEEEHLGPEDREGDNRLKDEYDCL